MRMDRLHCCLSAHQFLAPAWHARNDHVFSQPLCDKGNVRLTCLLLIAIFSIRP